MMGEIDPETGLIERESPRPYPFGPTSLAAILDEPLNSVPKTIALVDGERSWTYAELDCDVGQVVGALIQQGVAAGKRLLWSTPNSAELVIAFLASQRLGAIWVGVSSKSAASEIERIIAEVEPSLSALDEKSVADLFGGMPSPSEGPTDIDPHAPAAIAYTSGTTGKPKGAVHSQHSMLAPGLVSIEVDPPADDERIGTPLALTTLNMLLLGPISALLRASTAVVMKRTWAPGYAGDVREHAITKTFVVPTMLHDLANDEAVTPTDLRSLRSVIVGGAGAPIEIRLAFEDRFGDRPMMSYGLTEAPTGVVRETEDGSFPLPHVEVEVIDAELCLRPTTSGPWAHSWSPTLGYWRRPELTAALFRGDVLHTGDRGSIGERGSISVSGRISDMIVRGGANIDPAEVEAVLMEHPAVAEAAVVGLPDERLGERVGAAIVLSDQTDAEEIAAHVRERLAYYKVPESLLIVQTMPRNAMGKIDQTALRAEFS